MVQTQDLSSVYQLVSPNSVAKYLLEKYFPTAEYGDTEKWVNIHDKRVRKLLSLPRNGSITYNNSKPITKHSFDKYGTVSLWWLILFCSDYIHPHCIPTNTIIAVPELDIISSFISQDKDTGLVGKIIII